jgi:hypothetical protein
MPALAIRQPDAELILRTCGGRDQADRVSLAADWGHMRASSASYSAWVPMKNHTITSPSRRPTAR